MALAYTNLMSWDMREINTIAWSEISSRFGAGFTTSVVKNGFAAMLLPASVGGVARKFRVPIIVAPQTYQPFHIGGMWYRTTALPTADTILQGQTAGFGIVYSIRMDGSDIKLLDSAGTVISTLAGAISANTWHFIEWALHDDNDSGNMVIAVDGVVATIGTGADTRPGASTPLTQLRVFGMTNNSAIAYCDNMYYAVSATAVGSEMFLGPTFEIVSYGPQSTGGTTSGDPLDAGSWNQTGDAPPSTLFADAEYNGHGSGDVQFNGSGGDMHVGPSGGPALKTVVAAQWWNILAQSGSGKGSNFTQRFGKNGTVSTLSITPASSLTGMGIIKQAGDAEVPSASEFFVGGMGTAVVKHIICKDQYAWLGMYSPTVPTNIVLADGVSYQGIT